jgi:hypothetical protein
VPGPTLNEPRAAHLALRLADGSVLVAGGFNGSAASASAELLGPHEPRFVPVGGMMQPRMDGTGLALVDGAALVLGGLARLNQPLAEVERFDPATRRFAPVGRLLQGRAHLGAALLPDGQVLVAGGLTVRRQATAQVERFDPRSGRSELLPPLAAPRCKLAALTLRDGRVLVIGGSTDCEMEGRLASTEIFDPAIGRFVPGPPMQSPRYKVAGSATVLGDGSVLIAGGAGELERWVPGEPAFRVVGAHPAAAREFNTVTLLHDGSVLVAGGYDTDIRATADAWRLAFEPARDLRPARPAAPPPRPSSPGAAARRAWPRGRRARAAAKAPRVMRRPGTSTRGEPTCRARRARPCR